VVWGSIDQLMDLIDQVSGYSPQIAGKLRNLANDFQYNTILKLFEKGEGHGE